MNSQDTQGHPLDGVDEWERHDQHLSERNTLICSKREAEDGFVKTIIQLSTAIVLAVPGLMALNRDIILKSYFLLVAGIFLVSLALVSALCEQFLSSVAYEKQIEKTDAYYTKKSTDTSAPQASRFVKYCLLTSFVTFLTGILLISTALLTSPWRETMAQGPTQTPRPTPSPGPNHQPRPHTDSPGKSVPPTPAPTPPTGPRK